MNTEEKADKEKEEAFMTLQGRILQELSQYPRFVNWVEANYQIHVAPDPIKRIIEIKVVEEHMVHAQQNLAKLVNDSAKKSASKIEIAPADVLKKLS